MRKILRLIFVAFFVVIVGLFKQYDNVSAEGAAAAMAEQTTGLDSAPDNLGLDSNLFVTANFSKLNGSSTRNLATLSRSNGVSNGAIRMTYNTNQAGAIWSNVSGGNYIDIKKKQTLSMWLYFGPKNHTESGDFGDGMAFVLQNSADGENAFAHKGSKLGLGETLGVWGMDDDSSVKDTQTVASSAIQRSWALEFDDHINDGGDSGGADSFDKGITQSHIAYGYPADRSTYNYVPSVFLAGGNYFTQNHTNVIPVTLHDGNWHHLTIVWNPTKFNATFSFNDKNRDGTNGTNPIEFTTAAIDPSEFGVVPDDHLRWGFTATTGDSFQANLIAFESIPSSVEGDASASIKDVTQGGIDVPNDGSVNSNDELNINYVLNYNSGRDPWENITSDINLPANVTYEPDANGDIGTITYKSGYTAKIPAGALTGTTLPKYAFPKSLLATGDTATVSINGVAKSVNSNTNVASVHTKFDSDTLIKDVNTPSFTIKKAKPINLTLDQSDISVNPNTDANITGTVSYNDGSAITNSQMSVYSTLNGEKFSDFVMSDSDAAGHLKLTIPSDKLKQDNNTLEIYVADPNGNRTTTSKVIITKKGSLSLTVDKAYEFGDINNSSASRLISRKGNWDILVNDGREVSPTNTWELSADTTGLTNNTGKFNGDMVFRNSNGTESTLTGDNLVDIANGVKTQTGQQTTNIASDWDSSDGIFLRSNGLTTAGAYDGTINWTLSDTL